MKTRLPRLRMIAWLTIAALLAMMWSAVVQARIATRLALPWNELCSVADDPAATSGRITGKTEHAAHAGHCMFCAKQDLAHVLPARLDLPQPLLRRSLAPAPVQERRRAHTAWVSAAPRGPPGTRC
ncbi:DUF2946 family protein [Herbaspirillum aquaticum]|uniref:DUF2946 domain-containing protein n=1 Tax=Herbaspirillum aquaticum TaxID=568783 RepID=A0A225SWQ3_9BURK|nr:hypothetical protein CEJ45_07260 [Herbaspirillum aquaticum]